MEIGSGKIGEVGAFSAKIEKGKLVLTIDAAVPSAGAVGSLKLEMDSGIVMDAIAKAIPGQVDDAVIAVMKAALAQI